MSRPLNFRQTILDRLTALGWNHRKLASHPELTTMHPVSAYRYLSGKRDTDGVNIALMLHILGWTPDKGGFKRGPMEPDAMRSTSNPAKTTAVKGGGKLVEETLDVKRIRLLHAAGNSLGAIVADLEKSGWRRKDGKPHTRASVWSVVDKINKGRM